MDKSGMKAADLNLLTQGSVPQDCSLLIMNAPVKDISADEKETLTDYLKNGGRMLLLAAVPRIHYPILLISFPSTEWT